MRVLFSLFLASLLLISYSPPAFSEQKASGISEYRISANDTLEIKVYEEPDLTKIVIVAPDGTISYPFLGNIRAAGLTVRELEKNITTSLEQDYLVNPQVTVSVKDYANISILGQVKKPGSYDMQEGLTLTQAIAMAGGFTDIADSGDVNIIRGSGDGKQTIRVNVEQILAKEAADPQITTSDTIVVNELGRIFVMGQVARPGVYSLKRGMTVVEAVALAGGLTQIASPNGTKVIRVKGGKKETIHVPLGSILRGADKSKNITLEPEDTVMIEESIF